MNALTKAAQDVLAERQRQITAEGWTPEHDDDHGDGSMAKAAACYALGIDGDSGTREFVSFWPWDAESRKFSRDPRRNLVKAGALILAEIERLDRAAAKPKWKTCARCTTPDYCTNQLRGCDISESLEAGIAPLSSGAKPCRTCEGRGEVPTVEYADSMNGYPSAEPCPDCKGSGNAGVIAPDEAQP